MTARLLVVADADRAPKAREIRLHNDVCDARQSLVQALRTAGVTDPDRLIEQYELAEINLIIYWEGRAKRAEHRIRRLLASDLSEEQRAIVLSTVVSRQVRFNVLSDAERRLVDRYRQLDDACRQMLRTLVDRLSPAAPDVGSNQ